MTVIEFLNELSQQGVQLWVEDNKLRYRAQKGVLTQGQRHRLAQHKGEILDLLQKPRLLPLSFAQQRLWLLEQLEPESPAYNIPVAIRLQGVVDSAALGQSINEIIRRHEILRTTFSAVDGQPFQCVSSSLSLTVRRVDLMGLPENKRETQALQLAAEEARKPFDLSHGPLVGATLLRLGVKEHILLLIIHHIVFDGWSMELLYRELIALYRAFSSGQPSPLPELPLQYADFTIWQRQWLQGELRETQLAYWKAQLEDLPTLELPYDHPQPVLQSFQGAKHPLALPKDLSEALKALSKRAGITPFMLLLAVFKVLLYRYTGQDDIVVGTPIANRQWLETEGLIGFFVNMLVMRTTLSGHITFQELLSRIRQTALGAYAHQDLPFEKLVEELSPQRDSGGNPLFQVTFALRSAPRQVTGHSEWPFDQEVEKPDLEFQLWGDPEGLSGAFLYNVEFDLKTARFNLELQLWDDPEGFGGVLTYNSALFEAATIARMEGHFQTLLQGVVANPEARLADLPLLTASERHQMLVEWNNTRSDYPKDQCVHQLFEAQVARTPAAIAVTFGEQQLTYRQLNNRANQLAHYLQKHGVGPEVLVGICLERSLEMVIGLLGVLKAGGAYVPLDPTYPKERLAFMLNDTQAPVLLTQQRLLAGIPEPKAEVICLDVDWQIVSQESEHNPVYEVTSENLVYVIYTSGSTGQPKGVALPHRSLLNLVTWQLDHSTLPPGTKTLQFPSLSFDVSAQEILVTLCSGGVLVLVTEAIRQDSVRLARFVIDHAIERLFVPDIALQQLAEAITTQKQLPVSLKEVIQCGEQLQLTPAVIKLFSQLKTCVLHNHYGPAESHVVTAFALTDHPDDWSMLPPIGRPIANTQIYILDRHLKPVPIGLPGELYLGGDGLARGYLNRPDLTAERFIQNPFDRSGTRLYKTGDLACYLPDGNLEFLGRIDHQVKIRGFRVELGEIETVLGQHPSVREVVINVREEATGGRRLIAYIIPAKGAAATVTELRNFLKQTLPQYMIPSAYVMLEALPLTPSGKVDRRALPAPDQVRPELRNSFEAPRTPLEEMLAQIWTEVLGVEHAGIHDNFFDLGGHSLLATQVISRLGDIFQVGIPLRYLFEAPTVAGLAKHLETIRQTMQNLQDSFPATVGDHEEIEL